MCAHAAFSQFGHMSGWLYFGKTAGADWQTLQVG
jgi:hypothetical protein